MPLFRSSVDEGMLELFEEAGRNVGRAALLLRDLLAEFPERAGLARDLLLCEQEGDRIAHDIHHRLNGHRPSRSRRNGWLENADVYELTRALDDIVDYAEEAADQLGLYGVEATMEQATTMAEILVGAAEQVMEALRALRTGADMSASLVEIHRLENEGDRVAREALASLFASGIDPMVVIRWKDIFESLEQAVDACETVAHVLEGIALKRGRS
jgi:uncharacterized protein Yka (UPF0111/DUF47 family)